MHRSKRTLIIARFLLFGDNVQSSHREAEMTALAVMNNDVAACDGLETLDVRGGSTSRTAPSIERTSH